MAEQRNCMNFCQKLSDTEIETIWKIQLVFDDMALSQPR